LPKRPWFPVNDVNYFEDDGIQKILSIAKEVGLDQALEHVLEGKPSVKDIVELYKAPLWLLGFAARRVTDLISGRRVGFIVNMILNYTNVCVVGCSFCAFHRKPGSRNAYRLTPNEIVLKVTDYWRKYRIRQVLFQGGVDPSIPIEYYERVFKGIKEATKGEVAIHGLSAVEIDWIARSHRVSVKELVARLVEAGLDSVPGGGAEILSERVRKIISPRKTSAKRWLEVMDKVMELGVPTSATMVYGHVESLEERAEHLLSILQLQRRRKLVMAFIAWNFEPGHNELGKKIPFAASGTELLRNIAVARLVFRHEIPWIQASWLTAGESLGVLSLEYGANDWGGTLYEEKVLPATGLKMSILVRERIRELIEKAGFTAYERDNWYYPVYG